jgi:pyruvate/2-oxoglutarate dehydrogenase complex dihydrolipoamide acyltransferase (E2) component
MNPGWSRGSARFRISNLGHFGISHFTAIVMPPQVATLAVGALETGFNEFAESEEK